MSGPGKVLQQARRKKRYSMDKIYKATKIKKEFIEGLENDNVSAFPAEIYYKNFLKAYARFLAIDTTEIMNLYEQSKLDQQDDLFKQNNNIKKENKILEFYKKNKQLCIYIGYGIIAIILICIIIMIIPFGNKETAVPKEKAETSAPSVKQEQKITTAKPKLVSNQKQDGQKLLIKALEDSWIKVVGDGEKLCEKLLTKGNIFEATTKNEFVVKIGKDTGVELYFNDKLIDFKKHADETKSNTIILKETDVEKQ